MARVASRGVYFPPLVLVYFVLVLSFFLVCASLLIGRGTACLAVLRWASKKARIRRFLFTLSGITFGGSFVISAVLNCVSWAV